MRITGRPAAITRRMNNQVLEICDESGQAFLSIAEEMRAGTLVYTLAGQLRNEAAHEFEDEIMAGLSVCPSIILDFSGVTHIAGLALRSMLAAQQMIDEMDRASMTIVHVSPAVMELFRESGFSEILDIRDS